MDFDSSQPIYKQIIDYYKKQIVRGELGPGDKILSQREYAEQARVNPNTVQRAYREMEALQMVETVRGQGTFIRVSEETQKRLKREMEESLLAYFVKEMKSLGYEQDEILGIVQRKLEAQGEDPEDDSIQKC
ncbi:GntR family transcriptional regulator [Bacillota bacterium LX-D]|nr:GntR family transcriptional regulator [Bacillota bacterium LX-D]